MAAEPTKSLLFGAVLIAAAVTITAAKGVPRNAVFGADYAEATFVKGYDNSGGASNQFYGAALDNSCGSAYVGAKFAPLSGKSKTVLLFAGKEAIIYAVTNNFQSRVGPTEYGPVGVTVTGNLCRNKARFTPQPNTSYQIVQRRQDRGACHLEVTDISSGAPPADFVELPFEACVKAQKGGS